MKILVIGDTHFPFHHKNYIKFLKDVEKVEKPDKIVHIGDLVDNHALSNWPKGPEDMSGTLEWEKTKEALSEIYEAFPEAIWISGNHDNRPYRKAYGVGLPQNMVKTLTELYRSPPGWEVFTELIIDNVLYTHGQSAGGLNGWQNHCVSQQMSVVSGHSHTLSGVSYKQNKLGKQMFSMQTGSGIDEKAMAFTYGKNHKNRPVLSCGIVTNGKYAKVIPMDLTKRQYKGYKSQEGFYDN